MGWGISLYLGFLGGSFLFMAGENYGEHFGFTWWGYFTLMFGIVCIGGVIGHTRDLSHELYYLRKFLEKTRGEDPCEPGTDLYETIREKISPP